MIFHDHQVIPSETSISNHTAPGLDLFLVIKYIFNIDLGEGHMEDLVNIDCQFECEKKIYNLFESFDYEIINQHFIEFEFEHDFLSNTEIRPLAFEINNELVLRGPPIFNRL